MDAATEKRLLVQGAALGNIHSILILETDPQIAIQKIRVEVDKTDAVNAHLHYQSTAAKLESWAKSRGLSILCNPNALDEDGRFSHSVLFIFDRGTVEVLIGNAYKIKMKLAGQEAKNFSVDDNGRNQWDTGDFRGIVPILQAASSLPTTARPPATRTKASKPKGWLSRILSGSMEGA